jgi:hypothetical protein
MSFEINPCRAVRKKVDISGCDINNMNELCYGISRAYGDVYGPEVRKKLDMQCAELISEKKCSNGDDLCYMKRPSPPVGFNQVPHYFPALLKESNNPKKAYEICCTKCVNSKYPNSCEENCRTDADAVVKKSNEDFVKKPNEDFVREQYDDKKNDEKSEEPDYDAYKNAHPFLFFLGYGIVIVMIVILTWIFIRSLITNNIDT